MRTITRAVTSLGLLLGTLAVPASRPLGAQAAAATPVVLPAGRAGDAVRAYLAAIDAADSTAILAWLTRYDPEGDLALRTNRQLGLARRTGGFILEGIVRSDDAAIEAILRERKTNVQVRMELMLNAMNVADAFGLEPMTMHKEPTPASATRPAPPLRQAELVSRLRRLMDSLSRADAFAGVVSLSRRGVPVFERAYGDADRTTRAKNTLETAFNLGSINKVFTATAVRQLAAAGRIALDSTLTRAWPDYPNADVAQRVTITQILQHSSGITGNIFELPGLAPRDVRHNRQVLAAIASAPLGFAPGARQQYSNAGYVVLGGLIERVSGEDYYTYVQRHIFTPAGMTRTAHYPLDSLPPRTAIGYSRGGRPAAGSSAPLTSNATTLPGRGSAAGGGYSTVGDLKKFIAALRAGTISGGPPAGLGIAGGSPGVNAVVEGELPGGYDLIVLANLDPPSAERIAERVRGWLGVKD